jgi:hypothetical protein
VFIEWNGRDASMVGRLVKDDAMPDYLQGIASHAEALEACADPVRSAVTPEGWKLNWSRRGDHELYNLNEDPGETANLAVGGKQTPRMRCMADLILRWQERTDDTLSLPAL